MAGTVTHLAIADKIYSILGDSVIKNLPLFFGGNIAPDAIHAKKDYQRADKKRSHLCEGIRSYGYGYPEISELFKDRVNEFIQNYYLPAGDEKDLYLGYVTHLLADECNLLMIYRHLEEDLKNNEANAVGSDFRKNLADSVNNGEYRDIFKNISNIYDISIHDYQFKQNIMDILEAVWDYGVKDYVGANEINISKRWVIDTFFKGESPQGNNKCDKEIEFIDLTAKNIIERLSSIL